MAENRSKFWFLTFEYFKKDVIRPEDNLVILVHWLLLRNNFQTLQLDDESVPNNTVQPTDILPTNWTENEMYKLHYKRDDELFVLSGVKTCESFIFNLYNLLTKHVTSAAIGDVDSTVKWISDSANNKDNFYETICSLETDLIKPMQKEIEDKKNFGTQTQKEDNLPTLQSPRYPMDYVNGQYLPQMNAYESYGMSDLDPLGGGVGGMLFDPIRPQLRPRRRISGPGIPPLGRFDPIHPIDPDPMMPGSLRRPRPDHMRPPDFDDNMYM